MRETQREWLMTGVSGILLWSPLRYEDKELRDSPITVLNLQSSLGSEDFLPSLPSLVLKSGFQYNRKPGNIKLIHISKRSFISLTTEWMRMTLQFNHNHHPSVNMQIGCHWCLPLLPFSVCVFPIGIGLFILWNYDQPPIWNSNPPKSRRQGTSLCCPLTWHSEGSPGEPLPVRLLVSVY